jgi:hypothetical protein
MLSFSETSQEFHVAVIARASEQVGGPGRGRKGEQEGGREAEKEREGRGERGRWGGMAGGERERKRKGGRGRGRREREREREGGREGGRKTPVDSIQRPRAGRESPCTPCKDDVLLLH